MEKQDVILRLASAEDLPEMEKLCREAFWNLYAPGCDEHYLTHILPDSEHYLSDYSLVAEHGGEMAGFIQYTRSWVNGPDGVQHSMLTFGPLAVAPKYQRQGIGRKLVEKSAQLAKADGERAIIIFGNPSNYVPYGFVSASDFNISTEDGNFPMAMLVLPLYENALNDIEGAYSHAPVFNQITREAVEAFDSAFPPKEKKQQWTQVEFGINSRAKMR